MPNINRDIANLFKKKHRLQRLFRKHPLKYGAEYRSCRNLATKQVREARDAFNRARVEHKSGSSKDMWKAVNTILSTSNSSEMQIIFEIDCLETSDSSLITHTFNEYFASVGSNLAANFDYDEYRSNNYLNTFGERL